MRRKTPQDFSFANFLLKRKQRLPILLDDRVIHSDWRYAERDLGIKTLKFDGKMIQTRAKEILPYKKGPRIFMFPDIDFREVVP